MEAKNPKSQNIRNELLPLMFEMGRVLKREIRTENGDMVPFFHVETLRFIQEQGNPSMSEVAAYLKIAPPSATAFVNAFVKDGIVERTTDENDRRMVRLSLSVKGSEMLEETMRIRSEAFSRVFAHLSDQDCEELIRILGIITRMSPYSKNS